MPEEKLNSVQKWLRYFDVPAIDLIAATAKFQKILEENTDIKAPLNYHFVGETLLISEADGQFGYHLQEGQPTCLVSRMLFPVNPIQRSIP